MVSNGISFSVFLTMLITSCFPIKKMSLCRCNEAVNSHLKMSGIYMGKKDSEGHYKVFILFSNGYLYNPGYTTDINTAQQYLNKNQDLQGYSKEYMSNWGCFSIKDSVIKLQYFYEMHMGKFGVMEINGKILNDSAFVKTKAIDHNRKRTFSVQDTFLLKPFIKPDSANWLQKEKCE